MRGDWIFWRMALLAGLGCAPALAQTGAVEFNRDIRPILSDRCYTCHGPDQSKRMSKLRLDTEAGAKSDLGGHFAIVPGKAAESELIRRVTSDDLARRMPPAYSGAARLTDREIGLLTRWIAQGATWQKHWSFIPPGRPALPEVHDRELAEKRDRPLRAGAAGAGRPEAFAGSRSRGLSFAGSPSI